MDSLNHSQIKDTYKPKCGLVVYEQKDSEHFKSEYYIEEFSISENNGKFTAGPTSPMRLSLVEQVFKAIGKEHTSEIFFKGMIPKNIIYFKKELFKINLVWYEKPKKVSITIKDNSEKTVHIINTPITVFRVNDDSLSVYAVDTLKIKETTDLYYMPLPNIYDNNAVCLGNVSISEQYDCVEDIIEEYSNAFWQSEFNQFMGTKDKTTENIYEILRIAETDKFPIQLVNKTSLKIKKLNASSLH